MKLQLAGALALGALTWSGLACAQEAGEQHTTAGDQTPKTEGTGGGSGGAGGGGSGGGGATQPTALGLGLGAGLAIQLGRSAVSEAALDAAKIVRVTREADGSAGLVLEGHYLFPMNGEDAGTRFGIGPFVAVQAGSNNDIVDSIGIGLLLGLRRKTHLEGWGDRFNIGIGAMFDPNVRKLGDGIVKNQPLPAGETEIRYREEHAYRGVIIVTYSPGSGG